MKRIIIDEGKDEDTIKLSEVGEHTPIFAKRDGVLKGMVVHESDKGWILRTGGTFGATGHRLTLRDCLESCVTCGYKFFA